MSNSFHNFLTAQNHRTPYSGTLPYCASREQQLSFLHAARIALRAPVTTSTSIKNLPSGLNHEVQRFLWSIVLCQIYARTELNIVCLQVPYSVNTETGQLEPVGPEKHRIMHLLGLPMHSLAGVKPFIFSGIEPFAYFKLHEFMCTLSREFNPTPVGANIYTAVLQYLEMVAPFSVNVYDWLKKEEAISPCGLYLDFS